VQAGDADVVACVAPTQPRRVVPADARRLLHFARDASYPYGSGGPNSIFAFITAAYMRAHGATREDFGRIAVAQRANALANLGALFKTPLTLEQYLDARPIAEPIHLFDCVNAVRRRRGVPGDARRARARSSASPTCLVRGAIERHNAFADDPVLLRGGWLVDRDDLYAQADATPDAIDFVQTYDDYPVVVMLQFEDLGFCAKGEARRSSARER
jgi:acetyl-CoA acetyltransferase